MEPYKTIEYKGKTINLFYDDNTESPREWDNLGTMCYRHRNYILGDVEIPEHFYDDDDGTYTEIEDRATFKKWYEQEHGEIAIMLPLAIYEHGNITIWCGDRSQGIDTQWDCSNIGWVVVTKGKIRKEYNVKRITKTLLEKLEKILIGEIKTFDIYLKGHVVGYDVGTDSCGDFYDEKDAIEGAKSSIDYELKRKQEKREKLLRGYIMNHVPFQYRFV